MRDAGLDRGKELMVDVHVARRARDLQGDIGTALQRLGHAGAGLDAEIALGLLAGGNAASGEAGHRDHRDRATAQARIVVLLDRGEERIEIDEQAAQGHGIAPRMGRQYRRGASRHSARTSRFD